MSVFILNDCFKLDLGLEVAAIVGLLLSGYHRGLILERNLRLRIIPLFNFLYLLRRRVFAALWGLWSQRFALFYDLVYSSSRYFVLR